MVLTYTFLNHTFLKYVIVSHYIYLIYLIGFRLLDSLVFALNNSLATKIKNLNGHMTENWTPIKIQFRILLDLDSSIFILNNSLGTKLKIKWDT